MSDEIGLFHNLELRLAKSSMNADVRDMLDEGEARLEAGSDMALYARASGATIAHDPPAQLTVDEALSLDEGDVTMVGGGLRPRAPWEVLP